MEEGSSALACAKEKLVLSTLSHKAPWQHGLLEDTSEKLLFWQNFRPPLDFELICFQHWFLRELLLPLKRCINDPQNNKSVYIVSQLFLGCCMMGRQRGNGSLIEISDQLTISHSLVYLLINVLLPRRPKATWSSFIFSNAFGYGSVSNLVHHLLNNCLSENQS